MPRHTSERRTGVQTRCQGPGRGKPRSRRAVRRLPRSPPSCVPPARWRSGAARPRVAADACRLQGSFRAAMRGHPRAVPCRRAAGHPACTVATSWPRRRRHPCRSLRTPTRLPRRGRSAGTNERSCSPGSPPACARTNPPRSRPSTPSPSIQPASEITWSFAARVASRPTPSPTASTPAWKGARSASASSAWSTPIQRIAAVGWGAPASPPPRRASPRRVPS